MVISAIIESGMKEDSIATLRPEQSQRGVYYLWYDTKILK